MFWLRNKKIKFSLGSLNQSPGRNETKTKNSQEIGWPSKNRKVGLQFGLPAKNHLNGVSLAGRWWPNTVCYLWEGVLGRILTANKVNFIWVM